MMDLKEIIKWFIPCFHILLKRFDKMEWRVTFTVCLFLFFNSFAVSEAKEISLSVVNKESLVNSEGVSFNLTSVHENATLSAQYEDRSLADDSTGRTFGRPFKKMMAGLLPIIFQMGAATTWAAVATIIGFKTLVVTLAILKLLLIAGAAKVGALFASKEHHHHKEHGWTPPQKEIHLHIHNGGHGASAVPHEEHYGQWARDGIPASAEASKHVNVVYDPYGGPQTISTPYGNYVKVDSAPALNVQKREVKNR